MENRAGRTTQRWTPAQNPEPKTLSTPTKPKFSRKTRQVKGEMNRSGSGSCTQPERDGGNSLIEQAPGRPGSPAPRALISGRIYRPKKATERLSRTPPQVEATIPTRRKTSQHCESKTPQAETWGAEKRKIERFSIFNAFRRVKAVTTGGMENGLKKGGEARQGRQCLWPGTERNPSRVTSSKKIAKLDSFN